ncbi:MAG: hypothetical protein GY769_14885 [bacterium]|nr:hypothetical protein [bacterium]
MISESESAAIDPPAEPGALAPNLASVGGRLAATWLEPVSGSNSAGHRLRFALLGEAGWSDPVSIAAGSDFFANWADIPSLVQAGDRRLYAHWLAKTAEDTYAYSVFVARSDDRGSSWQPVGKLNSDSTPTEHGFVAMVPEGDGARAFWLDGREMIHRAPMTVRSARIEDPDGVERVLDARVCECCGTDAVVTREGPLVVYRDRSEDEVRDVFSVRRTAAGWTEPQAVHHDGWRIDGCPVNGPAVDAIENRVAVAWFTAAADNSRVQIAFSDDSGASFDAPIVVDDGQVLGRVDTALDAQGVAWVSWVSRRNQNVEILIQPFGSGGAVGEPRTVAHTTAARASGFPVLRKVQSKLFIAWVDVGEDPSTSRIRVRELRG